MYLIFFTQAHIIKDIYTHTYLPVYIHAYIHTYMPAYIHMHCGYAGILVIVHFQRWAHYIHIFCILLLSRHIMWQKFLQIQRNSYASYLHLVLNHIYIPLLTSLLHIHQHLSSIYNVRAKAWDLFKVQNWKGNKEMNNSALLQNRWEN